MNALQWEELGKIGPDNCHTIYKAYDEEDKVIYNTKKSCGGYYTLEGLLVTKFGIPKLDAIKLADYLEKKNK